MEQYISKSALVVEIERKRNDYINSFMTEQVYVLNDVLDFLDTLEVKEVDLDKELNDFIEQQKAWIKDDWVVEYNNGDSFNHIYDLRELAKHFFELGIKALKAL